MDTTSSPHVNTLKPNAGANKRPKIVGRGTSSGHGKTSGRGGKGQTARNGGNIPARFEGGQWPLYRRIPKRGFQNPFRKEFSPVNIAALAKYVAEGKLSESNIDLAALKKAGILPKSAEAWKLLAKTSGKQASLSGKNIKTDAVSENARKLAEGAGAKIEVIEAKSKVLTKGKKASK
ncbi:MAG: 50S ribosomal protein L15 [Spirochaetes bacterium]|nr:50S ribosomal protein L15 [Spirochaetota bacterium]